MTRRADLDDLPVIVLSRDRLGCLSSLVAWLERAGMTNVVLFDLHSTYEPLVDYLQSTPHSVIRLGHNAGPWAVWEHDEIRGRIQNQYYVVSDPDVIPDPDCPPDAIPRFHELLQRYDDYTKAGFGLRIDDIPDTYRYRNAVLNWEKQFWRREIEPGVYEAPIDTTFALYRPSTAFSTRALRTGAPYVARHLPWYQNPESLPEDELYYQAHASQKYGNWRGELSEAMRVHQINNPVHRYLRRRAMEIKRSLAKRGIRLRLPRLFGR